MTNISTRAMLVDLSIKQWAAAKHDKKVSREVADNHGNDVAMGRFNKQLLGKGALETIKKIAGAARTEHYKRTLPWSEDGARILSSTGYFDYSQKMREFQYEWENAVRDFEHDYPQFVSEARARLNGLFNDTDYPSVGAIADKFAFGYNVFPLPSANDFRVDLGNSETERIKRDLQTQLDATLDKAMEDVWGRMRDVVSHMCERLRAYNVDANGVSNPFRDSLVQNVRDLVELLPSLNVTNNGNIADFSERINRELTKYSAESLRVSDHARNEVASAAETILKQMGDFI